jgi:hypothetical protein
MDLPFDGVEALSTDALKNEVRRVVAGPSSWSSTSLDPPILLRKQTVPLPPRAIPDTAFLSATHLIAFVEQSDGGALQCLDLQTGHLMWSWSRPGHDVFLAKFDLRSSTGAVVAFVFSDQCVLSGVLMLFK